jgi:hypothetical protein
MRLVSTSRNTGPSPERACSSASSVASYTSETSCPLTLIERMSYASARFDMSSHTGECCQPGVDSAQWLFSQTNSRLRLPELPQVERLVEGADVRRAVAEERDRDARLVTQLEREARADDRRQPAADHGVGAVVAALDVVQVHRAAVAVRAALDLPVELAMTAFGCVPRASV